MHIDGFTVLFFLREKQPTYVAVAAMFRALQAIGVAVDISRMPHDVADSLNRAIIRQTRRSWIDRLFPFLINREFRPVTHLIENLAFLSSIAGCTPKEYFLQAVRRLRLPVGTVDGCRFTFLGRPLGAVSDLSAMAIVFDWRSYHKEPGWSHTVEQILNLIGNYVEFNGAIGGSFEYWADVVSMNKLEDVLQDFATSGAPLVVTATPQVGLFQRRLQVAVQWRGQGFDFLGPLPEVNQPVASGVQPSSTLNPFAAKWFGSSGHFAGPNEGRDNAERHFKKHAPEWPSTDMRSSGDYVQSATALLDNLDVYEMWQPTNHAVIKYDEDLDTLAIGGICDGNIHTFFRPRGSAYVIRKLEARHWTPPPIEGVVEYGQITESEQMFAGLMRDWRALFDEAMTESMAFMMASSEGNMSSRLVSALAYQTKMEYFLFRLRHRYLTDTEERQVDECELSLAEARASIEVALDNLQPETAKIITTSCLIAVQSYSSAIVEALSVQSAELIEELLFCRDQIQYVRIGLRSQSWLCRYLNINDLETIWTNLYFGDALLKVNLKPAYSDAGLDNFPESFFWRVQINR